MNPTDQNLATPLAALLPEKLLIDAGGRLCWQPNIPENEFATPQHIKETEMDRVLKLLQDRLGWDAGQQYLARLLHLVPRPPSGLLSDPALMLQIDWRLQAAEIVNYL